MTPLDAAQRLAQGLETSGFDYAIGGAIALAYWAAPRATIDVDIAVAADAMRVPDLISALRTIGCEMDPQKVQEAAMRGDFGVRLGGVRVDVFLPVTPLSELALETRVRVPLGDREVWIVRAEECALLKLLFGRAKDYADLERLFAARGADLDFSHLDAWVAAVFEPADPRTSRYRELRDRVQPRRP